MLNRRGLLSSLFIAPAIITTPGLLMAVSAKEVPRPHHLLTPNEIAREFSRLLRNQTRAGFVSAPKQSCVSFVASSQDLTLPMADYSERYLAPAAGFLAAQIGAGRVALGRAPAVVRGVDFYAVHEENGVSTRVVRSYDIWNDICPTQLDVIHS